MPEANVRVVGTSVVGLRLLPVPRPREAPRLLPRPRRDAPRGRRGRRPHPADDVRDAADAAAGRRRRGVAPDARRDRAPRPGAPRADPLRRRDRRRAPPRRSAHAPGRVGRDCAGACRTPTPSPPRSRQASTSTRRRAARSTRRSRSGSRTSAWPATGARVLREASAALRERDFRLLFLARTASLLGSSFAPVALAFAVLDDLDGSATELGLVLAAAWVPQILLTLVGGVWADRLPRNLVMVGTDLTDVRRPGDRGGAPADGDGRALARARAPGRARLGGRVLLARRRRADAARRERRAGCRRRTRFSACRTA